MKRIIFSIVVLFITCFVAGEAANAQSFLIGPKAEKKWMEYFYRASGAAPAPKPSELMSGGGIGFTFTRTPDVSGFSTKHPAYNGTLLGDLTAKTVSADMYVNSLGGVFTYYGQGTLGNPCGTPANVRLYFETNNNELGESQYWWSNPVSYPLATGPATLTASLIPANWSDRDGHLGTFNPAHTAAFNAAVADVQQIGLSFGGGCFFANGVGEASGNSTFTLTNFTAN